MTTTTLSPSYIGVDVYVGIDVHQRTYRVCAQVEQAIVKQWTTTAEPAALAQQLLKYFSGGYIHSVYEAGFSGYVLHRTLVANGIDNIIVHPASIEVAAHCRVKTDKRDAQKLSAHLEAGRLQGISIPASEKEQQRLLSRTRTQLVQMRAKIKTQIRMKAHQFGLIDAHETREMSHALVAEILADSVGDEFEKALRALYEVWQSLEQQIADLERQLRQQAQGDPCEQTYRSAPAIGAVSARILSNELGDLSQFTNERQLFSYLGLTPSEHSSGEQVRKGHITKQGNRYVRAVVVEIAWRALRKDPDLKEQYERLLPRVGAKRAIVAVARKLIGKLRAAFRKGELYQIGYNSRSQLAV